MVFSNVIVDVTVRRRSFVFSRSSVQISDVLIVIIQPIASPLITGKTANQTALKPFKCVNFY